MKKYRVVELRGHPVRPPTQEDEWGFSLVRQNAENQRLLNERAARMLDAPPPKPKSHTTIYVVVAILALAAGYVLGRFLAKW